MSSNDTEIIISYLTIAPWNAIVKNSENEREYKYEFLSEGTFKSVNGSRKQGLWRVFFDSKLDLYLLEIKYLNGKLVIYEIEIRRKTIFTLITHTKEKTKNKAPTLLTLKR